MSVVCERCGTPNRANAMFCIGCAGRLPAFQPSAPSALERQRASREPDLRADPAQRPLGADSMERPRRRSARVDNDDLPAASPGFWLRLLAVLMLMGLGFLAWYWNFVRHDAAPSPSRPSPAAVAPAPTAPPTATIEPSRAAPPSAAGQPPVTAAAPESTASAANATAAHSAIRGALGITGRTTPADGAGDAPATRGPTLSAAPAAPGRPAPGAPVGTGSNALSPAAPSVATWTSRDGRPRSEQPARSRFRPDESAMEEASNLEAARRARAAAAGQRFDDVGPPVAPGPGPLYEATPRRGSSSTASASTAGADSAAGTRPTTDLGPPVAPGPGPQYDYGYRGGWPGAVRSPPDLGPPVAPGPGPQYNFNMNGSGRQVPES